MESNNIRVEFVEAETLEELKELTNKAVEAIQVNIRNVVKDIQLTSKVTGGYVVQITYEEKAVLNE